MKLLFTKIAFAFFFVLISIQLNAQDTLYWVGGTGNWDAAINWSLTSGGTGGVGIPDSSIFTVMDQNSFTADGQTISLPLEHNKVGGMWWRNLNYDVELYFPSDFAASFFCSIVSYGSINLHTKLTPVYTNSNNFWEVRGDQTINFLTGDVNLNRLELNLDSGGILNLMKKLTISKLINFVGGGTFNSNDLDIECESVYFSPGDSDTIFANFGQSHIIAEKNWDAEFYIGSDSKWLVLDVDETLIDTQEFTPGKEVDYGVVRISRLFASTYYKCGVLDDLFSSYRNETSSIGTLILDSASSFQIFGHNTIRNSLVIKNEGVSIEINEGDTLSINGDILQPYLSLAPCASNIVFESDRTGEAYFFKKNTGTLDIQLATLKDANTMGAATFNAEDCVDLGNNTGWNFISNAGPKTLYWIGGSGLFNDTTHWSNTSGGVVSGCVPGGLDKVIFDANSFSSLGDSVIIPIGIFDVDTMVWKDQTLQPNLHFSGSSGTENSIVRIFGSLRLHNNITTSYSDISNSWKFVNPDTCLIDSKGKFMSLVVFDSDSAYFKLLSPLNADFINHRSGYFDTGGETVSTGSYVMSSGCSSTECPPKVLRLRSSLFIANTFDTRFNYGAQTILSGTSTIVTSSFKSGNDSDVYYNLILDSSNIILVDAENHSFNEIKITGGVDIDFYGENTINGQLIIENPGTNIQFESGELFTIRDGIVQNISPGPCNEFAFLSSDKEGLTATLSVPNNGFSLNLTAIHDVHITGPHAYVVNDGLNMGNTGGWTITDKINQDYYYLGTDDIYWDNPSNWSLSSGGSATTCLPGPTDNIIFDQNSFSGSFNEVYIRPDEVMYCRDMSWNNVPSGSMLRLNGYSVYHKCFLKINGSLSMQADMLLDYEPSFDFIELNGGDTNTITTNGFSMPSLYLKGGGVYGLTDTYNGESIYVHSGTFDSQNFNMNLSGVFSTASDGYKKVRLRTSTISCDVMDNGYVSSDYPMDFLSHTSAIITSSLRSKNNIDYYNVWINSDNPDKENYEHCSFNVLRFSGSGTMELTGSISIYDKLLIDQAGASFKMHDFDTLFMYGSIETGGIISNPVHIYSSEYFAGNPMTIFKSNGHLCIEHIDFRDVEKAGSGQLNALNCVDGGLNSGIDFISSVGSGNSLYWIGQSGQWQDIDNWAFVSGGCPADRFPGNADTVHLDDNSFLLPDQQIMLTNNEEVYSIWASNTETAVIKISDTLLSHELRLTGGNIVLKNGHFKIKTAALLNTGAMLTIDTSTFSFVNYPDLTIYTGLTVGASCSLAVNFSEIRICGQSTTAGTKSVDIHANAIIDWVNSGLIIKPPASGEPNNNMKIDFGGHTINGQFVMNNITAPNQIIFLESDMVINGQLKVKYGLLNIQPGFQLTVQ